MKRDIGMADYENERNNSSIPYPHIFVLGTKYYSNKTKNVLSIGIQKGIRIVGMGMVCLQFDLHHHYRCCYSHVCM